MSSSASSATKGTIAEGLEAAGDGAELVGEALLRGLDAVLHALQGLGATIQAGAAFAPQVRGGDVIVDRELGDDGDAAFELRALGKGGDMGARCAVGT